LQDFCDGVFAYDSVKKGVAKAKPHYKKSEKTCKIFVMAYLPRL